MVCSKHHLEFPNHLKGSACAKPWQLYDIVLRMHCAQQAHNTRIVARW